MNIGNSIQKIRQKRGLTQSELSKLTGLKQNAISRIENNTHHPSESTLELLAQHLDVEKETFYYLEMLNSIEAEQDNIFKQETKILASKLKNELSSIFNIT